MNIHLVSDEKFINLSVNRFEHYYPGQNIFFVEVSKSFNGEFNYVCPRDEVIPISLRNKDALKTILSYCNEDVHLFIHNITPHKSPIVNQIKKHINAKTYWIFYGADMYHSLNIEGLYELFDCKTTKERIVAFIKRRMIKWRLVPYWIKEKKKCIETLDYFCFWNHFDYQLLIQNSNTSAKFKFFRYYNFSVKELEMATKDEGSIIVNHSSSRTGNHLTVLESLIELDKKKVIKKLYTPLSYGDEKLKKKIIDFCTRYFDYCFEPLMNYMPKAEYYKCLSSVEIAIFGHRRQEGGNNIFYLLASGCKVFLRKENNLLKYLRERGYCIFEFEKDLNSMDDLNPLELYFQNQNRRLVSEEFSQGAIDKTYENLIS